jgi:hypothetical protein
MVTVRRSLAGLLLGIAAALGSLALSGLWLQLTAFSPARTSGAAHDVLSDDGIRNEVARVIAEATAPTLGVNPAAIQRVVASGAATGEGSDLLEGVVADAHASLIGTRTKPVLITAEQMVPLVGNQIVATVQPATVTVPAVSAITTTRNVVKWMVPITGAAAVLLIIVGFAAHPERAELLRSISFLLLGSAIMLVLVGYIVPALILPLFSKDPWVAILPSVARHSLPRFMVAMFTLIVSGLACLAASGATRRRDRWSQPSRTRYNPQRRWS